MMEIKTSPSGQITGYASCWLGPADAVNDLVAPGAFRAALAAGLPAMLREHKGAPVGAWTAATEDDIGLRVTGSVTDAATLADLRSGRLDGLSIGFVAGKAHRDPAGKRVLDQVSLPEISIVKRPASSRARVLSVKSAPAGKDIIMAATNAAADPVDASEDQNMGDRMSACETSLTDIGARVGKIEEAVTGTAKSVKSLETIARRPGAAAVTETKSAADTERTAFTGFIRRGVERMDGVEVKSLRVSDGTTGGFLAPEQFLQELQRNVTRFSPIRGLARVATMSGSNVLLPRRTGTLTGYWVSEDGDRTSTGPSYGQANYGASELACFVDVSNQLLEDSAFDIASELALDFAEEFGKLEGTAFVSGNGVGKPQGFMANDDLLYTASADASTIKADGLIKLYHDLAPAYRQNATWVMNSSTLATVRQLKDGTTNQYLLTVAGQFGGTPQNTLFGRPVVEAQDMPDIAGGAYPVVFGDFQSGYRIFDRLSLSVLRDPYSVATSGCVRFHARRRLAAGVAKSEALRKLKIATS